MLLNALTFMREPVKFPNEGKLLNEKIKLSHLWWQNGKPFICSAVQCKLGFFT